MLHAADSPQESNTALNPANTGDAPKQYKGSVKVFILAGQSNMDGQGAEEERAALAELGDQKYEIAGFV